MKHLEIGENMISFIPSLKSDDNWDLDGYYIGSDGIARIVESNPIDDHASIRTRKTTDISWRERRIIIRALQLEKL